MNTGAFGENFPYSNFHDLNMDWIIKIAKDFLDQYTHIQETIDTGLTELQTKADTLEALLQEWYDTHSEDIANQLADALTDLNTWYNTHQDFLNDKLAQAIADFQNSADAKAEQTIASIPSDYTELFNRTQHIIRSMIFENCYNLLNSYESPSRTNNGVTFTWNTDHTECTLSGTASGIATTYIINSRTMPEGFIPGETYYADFNSSGDVGLNIRYYAGGDASTSLASLTSPRFITIPETATGIYIRIFVPDGVTVNETVKAPILYRASTKTNEDLTTIAQTNSDKLVQIEDGLTRTGETPIISISGNYFNPETATWYDGFWNTTTGTLTPNADYEYAFVTLKESGVYVTQIATGDFGSNVTNLPLFNKNKEYIGYIPATSSVRNIQVFSVTDNDLENAMYTIISHKKGTSIYNKLFINPPQEFYSDLANFPVPASMPNPPIMATASHPLYRKTLVCDGDSICAGDQDKPYGASGWFSRLSAHFEMIGHNYAVGGGTIAVLSNDRYSVARNMETIHDEYENIDYLILEGGTNDADLFGNFTDDTPPTGFGTWTPDDFTGNYDIYTFCGAVETLFYRAMTYYPHAKIGFIITMEMGTSNTQANRRKRYFDEIVKIANKWHVNVLNLWEICHADARLTAYYDPSLNYSENVTAKKFYYDGQHPTSYGYDQMQSIIEHWVMGL